MTTMQVSVTEALQRLPQLLAAAEAGENVMIQNDSGRTFQIVPLRPRPAVTGIPKAGRWQGLVDIPDDFDEPVAELQEYME